jgi:mannose-1-phosphate guanylyltransferase
LTFTTPKQMLPIAGVPMIERVVAHLAHHGVEDVVLSMGYRPDAFVDAYPDGVCAGVPLTYAIEPTLLDTAGAVRFAVQSADVRGTFIVANGDVLTALDVGQLVELHRARGAQATISLTAVDDPSGYGVVPTDDRGRVTAFIEKPARDEAPTNLINAGTYVLESSVIESIPDGRRVSLERETFPALVETGDLYALASDAYWIDTGTPATYIQANIDALVDDDAAGGRTEGLIAPDAVVRRSAIGRGCRIDARSEVVESVLLDGAHIGADVVVHRSVVGGGAVVGAGARLEDLTVIGSGETIAARCSLSGARVPEPA